jgi:uncharacterized protein DUF3551
MLRIVTAAGFLALIGLTAPSLARAAEGPWCAIINFGTDVFEDCQYRTPEQCLPAVTSGFRGFCNQNPHWHGAEEPRPRRKHLTRQR